MAVLELLVAAVLAQPARAAPVLQREVLRRLLLVHALGKVMVHRGVVRERR